MTTLFCGVTVPAIPEVKAIIRELEVSKVKDLAQKALQCKTAAEVWALVKEN